MSDTSSNSSNASSSSSESDSFDASDLLQVIAILMLPNGSDEDLDIVAWKDSDIIELLEQLFDYFEFDDCNFKLGFGKIIAFINNNRKFIKKRRVNLNKIDNDKLRLLIADGLNEMS
jgi:hypothetical protein